MKTLKGLIRRLIVAVATVVLAVVMYGLILIWILLRIDDEDYRDAEADFRCGGAAAEIDCEGESATDGAEANSAED